MCHIFHHFEVSTLVCLLGGSVEVRGDCEIIELGVNACNKTIQNLISVICSL